MCGRAIHITHWVCKKSVPFLRTDKIGYFRASNSMACPGHAVLGRVIPKTLRTTNLQSITTKCKQRLSLGRSLGKPCPRRHALRMLSLAGSVPAPCERRTYTRKHNPNIFMRWGRELSQQWSSGEFRQTKVCNQKGQKGSTGRLGRAVNPASGYVSILFSNPPCYWFPVFPRESDRKLYCLVGCYVYFGVRTLDNTTAAPMWKLCSLGPVHHIFKSWTSFLVAVLTISFQLESEVMTWGFGWWLWITGITERNPWKLHQFDGVSFEKLNFPTKKRHQKPATLLGKSHYFCQLHPLAITFCMA